MEGRECVGELLLWLAVVVVVLEVLVGVVEGGTGGGGGGGAARDMVWLLLLKTVLGILTTRFKKFLKRGILLFLWVGVWCLLFLWCVVWTRSVQLSTVVCVYMCVMWDDDWVCTTACDVAWRFFFRLRMTFQLDEIFHRRRKKKLFLVGTSNSRTSMASLNLLSFRKKNQTRSQKTFSDQKTNTQSTKTHMSSNSTPPPMPESIEDKIQYCLSLKEEGNHLFRAQQYTKAIRKYKTVCIYLSFHQICILCFFTFAYPGLTHPPPLILCIFWYFQWKWNEPNE